jgi:mitochondrial fission protein ELM1
MRAKAVWILDEGSQGHVVQSRGLVRELTKEIPLDVTEISIHSVFPRKFGRSVIKRLLRLFPNMATFRSLHPRMKLPRTKPELFVSSGPHSLAALEFLGKHYGCPSVFVQGTIHVPEGAVTAIMRPFEGEHRGDYVFIPLLFTEITPEVVAAARESYLAAGPIRPEGPINTLFIGNSSAKIRFGETDWDGMIRFVNNQWKIDGTRWLITTSYRTGGELEGRFKRGIESAAILDAVWYSESPRNVTRAFLGLADRVFVTMDSLTMISEAVSSGRPTFAICPAEVGEDESNTHLRYINGLAKNGLIARLRPSHGAVLPTASPAAGQIDYSGAIHELMNRIRWKP